MTENQPVEVENFRSSLRRGMNVPDKRSPESRDTFSRQHLGIATRRVGISSPQPLAIPTGWSWDVLLLVVEWIVLVSLEQSVFVSPVWEVFCCIE